MTEGTSATVAWRSFRDEARSRLAAAGFQNPDVEARRLVEEASGHVGPEYWDGLDQPASVRGVTRFDDMLGRRLSGEPLQYVLGRWAFRQLDLYLDNRVLIPRPETEVVAGLAVDFLAEVAAVRSSPVAVDLGTGSGAIGLSLALECATAQVWLTDISAEALAVARANLTGLGTSGARVTIAEGSWFAALDEGLRGRVDVVVSNPPYIADAEDLPEEVAAWEPDGALRAGPDGTDALRVILAGAREWLRPGGAVIVELAPHQATATAEFAAGAGLVDVAVVADLTGRDRVVWARRPC